MKKTEAEKLIESQMEKHPEMKSSERTAFVLLLLFVAVRIVPAVFQTAYVTYYGLPKIQCLISYVLIILSILFAVTIAQGARFFTGLGIICSAYPILNEVLDYYLPNGTPPEAGLLRNAYLISIFAACFIQVAAMLFILLSPKIKAYLDMVDSIRRGFFDDGDVYI
ncbi:MAG: hypothetical protein J5933_04870 [Clostridia bacterium]|nr:hypothetical protein [Clostridia bacterium]